MVDLCIINFILKSFSGEKMLYESILYENLANNRVQCNICNHNCIIDNDSYGLCGTRLNNEGTLYSITYGQVSSFNTDPVEKKPFYHFHPNSLAYSVGGFGCNMSCLACQNIPYHRYNLKTWHQIIYFQKPLWKMHLNPNLYQLLILIMNLL